jgi:RNA polymerase sigma-70 factor (ECF subfamily)
MKRLLQRLRNNHDHTEKFEQIWEIYQGVITQEARRHFSNSHDIEDAISEAGAKIYKNITKIETIASYQTRAYIVCIVKSVCIDLLRKQKRSIPTVDEVSEDIPDGKSNILDFVVSNESCAEMIEIINQLPERYRTVLYMSINGERSHREIADALGISEAASKMLLYRAKKTIKEKLAGDTSAK